MAKVTNKQIIQISTALAYLSQLDTPAWYQIGRNVKKTEKFVTEINALRTDIINKFVKKDDKGQPLYANEAKTMLDLGENQAEADKLWSDLQNEEVEIDFFQFKYDLLKDSKINSVKVLPLIDLIIIE